MTKEELAAYLTRRGVWNEQAIEIASSIDPETLSKMTERAADAMLDEFGWPQMRAGGGTARVDRERIGEFVALADRAVEADLTRSEVEKQNPGADDEELDAAVDLAEARKAVLAGTASDAQRALVQRETGSLDRDVVTAALAGEQSAKLALQQALGTTSDADIEAVRRALMAYAGLPQLSDLKMSQLVQSSIGKGIASATLAKQRGYDTGSFTRYTDAAGRTVYVSADTEEALKGYLPGFGDYNRTATSTLVDSQARFAGPNGIAQNVYTLWAHTIGVLNPNFDPQKAYQPEDIFGSLSIPTPLSESELRKNFLRAELQRDNGKLPPRFLPDGSLNPVYERGNTADKFGDTPTSSVMWATLWDNPEMLIDQTWWTEDRLNAFNQFKWDATGSYNTDAAVASDLMRQSIYAQAKPKLDAYIAEFGPGKELAAIVAYHKPELGRKMASGVELSDEELTEAYAVFQGVDPAKVGIITDSLDRYAKQGRSTPSGSTIRQPDRQKITEGFRELYRQMFRAEPTDDELVGLVEDVAQQYIGAQYRRQEFDTSSAMMAEVRGTDLYSQLYGAKPKGMDEGDYIGQFERTGQALLGGAQASSEAVQAGMRSGNANVTAQVVGAEKASWDNSGFLERFFRSMQVANEMT